MQRFGDAKKRGTEVKEFQVLCFVASFLSLNKMKGKEICTT